MGRSFKYSLLFIYFTLFLLSNCTEDANNDIVSEDLAEKASSIREPHYDNDEFEEVVVKDKEQTEDEVDTVKESQKFHEKEYINSKSKVAFSLYEVLMVILLGIYLLNCYYGKSNNDVFAQKWFVSNKEFFMDNYAHVGIGTADNKEKESYNSYKFYASGRVYCKSLLISIDLKKRHDLVSLISSLLFFQEKDRINFEFSLEPNVDITSVFCLCRPKDLKQLKKSYSDIDFFTKGYSRSFMSDKLYLYAEHSSLVTSLFENKGILAAYKRVEDCLELIYYTDRKTFSREPFALYISFDLRYDTSNLHEKFKDITYFVHLLVDELSTTKFSDKDKKDADKNRVDFEKLKIKELTEKQTEEYKSNKQKQKEEKYKNLSKEKLQKLEEKEKERELKKLQHKKVKMIKY